MSGEQNKFSNNNSFLTLVSILLTVNIWVYSSAATTTTEVKNTVNSLATDFGEFKGDMQLIKYRVNQLQKSVDNYEKKHQS